jgi:hypothetical protein
VTALTIPKVQTQPGADLMVCWNGLAKDLLCHDITAAGGSNGIDNVGFAKILNVPQADVADQLAVGQFDDSLAETYGDYYVSQTPGQTCAMLSQFKLGEVIVPATDYVLPAVNQTITYMLVFTTGTTPAVGTKSMLFLEPTSGSTVTTVNAIDACTAQVLAFDATLGQDMPISQMDSTKWEVGWGNLTKDSFGNAIRFTKVDKVLVGWYQGKTKADLQAGFKDIEISATTLYEVPVALGKRTVDLAKATARGTGAAFPGFTETGGVYALAVLCTQCQVPAPILFTVLTPQP